MRFDDRPTIFQQIAEQFRRDIMSGKWDGGERLPAIRETAVELQVNPNTVVKSYAELEAQGVIFKQRGLGYYVAPGARERIAQLRRESFFSAELPRILDTLALLEIPPEELAERYRQFLVERSSRG